MTNDSVNTVSSCQGCGEALTKEMSRRQEVSNQRKTRALLLLLEDYYYGLDEDWESKILDGLNDLSDADLVLDAVVHSDVVNLDINARDAVLIVLS